MDVKKIIFFIYLFATFAYAQKSNSTQNKAVFPEGYIETQRTKTNLNNNWTFHLGKPKGKPEAKNYDDSKWKKVSVPHTLQLVSYELDSIKETWVQEKYLRDFGWYRKHININANASQKVFLEFEGVHNVTDVWINGKKVGVFDVNGYVPFHFDITNFVKLNADNVIVIKADNSYNETIAPDPHRTDYVKFGGIYRDVYLVTTNKLHVNFNWENFDAGVHINTPTVNKKNGTVSIKTTLKNDNKTPKNCKIVTRVINDEGYVLKTLSEKVSIAPNSDYSFRQTTTIEDDYHLWSPDTPYLYRVHSTIFDDETPVDFIENRFGFRTFQLVKGKGFVLNGEPLFLVGANRHQNYPNIGDAIPNSFHYNEALQYKKAGFNILRLSHYTQDDAFLDACDELGIIVYEEPSTWIEWGNKQWFDKLALATRHMIRNHRNHPSIMFWGAGINHRGPVPKMQEVTKEEDPFRLTASASSPWNGVKDQGVTDIHATMDYRRTEFPESAFNMLMEHGSSANAEVNQFHISRYKASKSNIAVIAWLGADYNHLQPDVVEKEWTRDFMTTYGILSAYRTPKPVYYWYQSELVKKPIIHIADETASTNGKIRVFSNCQEVALYHNDKLVAIQKPDNSLEKLHLNHPSFTFNFRWSSGELKAIGYTNNEKIIEHTRTKQEKPHHIKLDFNIVDKPFYAGGSDLRLIHAAIVDKNGEVVTNATNKIEFSIYGAGSLVDNGKIEANPAVPYYGIASMYVRSGNFPGEIVVTAKAKGLILGKATIKTSVFETNELLKAAKPMYDYPIVKVDIGGEKQLVQFEWDAWTGKTTKDVNYKIDAYNAEVNVSGDSDIKWFGNAAMLGDVSFVGTDGLYAENGVLKLKISNLKKGNYAIETYHHTRKGDQKLANNIEIKVDDSNGFFTKIADDHLVKYYQNENTGERKPIHVKSFFASDGKNPVYLEFKNLDKGNSIWLNGFILKRVKD